MASQDSHEQQTLSLGVVCEHEIVNLSKGIYCIDKLSEEHTKVILSCPEYLEYKRVRKALRNIDI